MTFFFFLAGERRVVGGEGRGVMEVKERAEKEIAKRWKRF